MVDCRNDLSNDMKRCLYKRIYLVSILEVESYPPCSKCLMQSHIIVEESVHKSSLGGILRVQTIVLRVFSHQVTNDGFAVDEMETL